MKNIKVNIPDEIDTITIGVGEIRVGFMVDDVPIYCDILHHDGHVIDTENSDLEKGIITFKKEESKYTMELLDKYTLSIRRDGTVEGFKKYGTFIRLVETCKEWNRIDGFDWETENKCSFIVTKNRKRVGLFSPDIEYWTHTSPFRFKNVETAKLFLETFREEIEIVKDLI